MRNAASSNTICCRMHRLRYWMYTFGVASSVSSIRSKRWQSTHAWIFLLLCFSVGFFSSGDFCNFETQFYPNFCFLFLFIVILASFFYSITSCKSWFFFHINDKDHPLHVHCLALDEYDWEVSAIQPNRMKLKHLTLGVISISYSTPNNDVNENFAPTWSWIADDVLLLNHCFSIQML